MKLKLPRGLEFDINDIPDDFDDQVKQCFADFTHGTAEAYTYQDKLRFIDIMTERTHLAEDDTDSVYNLMESQFGYQTKTLGQIPDKEDYLNMEFMEDCYRQGKEDMSLYSHFREAKHDDEKLMKLFCRVITIVMAWEAA